MSAVQVLAVIGGLTLAAVIGVSDAPNAVAALVSGRTRSFPAVAGWSFGWHLAGGLLAGVAVARTVVGLVHVPPGLLAPVLAARRWSASIFTWLTTRRGGDERQRGPGRRPGWRRAWRRNGVAVARYESVGDGVAEVAVAVTPTWRDAGLATELVQLLAQAAIERGIHAFTGTYLVKTARSPR